MAVFEAQFELPCSPDEAFTFLTTPETILQISPPDMGLKYVAVPDQYHLGAKIEFQVISFGQVQTIHHEVIEFEEPNIFVETMTKGLAPRWVHTHRFEPNGTGGVIVVDEIDFDKPGGIIGLMISEQKIIDSLEDGFDYRRRKMMEMFDED